jgi:hypothetical protein
MQYLIVIEKTATDIPPILPTSMVVLPRAQPNRRLNRICARRSISILKACVMRVTAFPHRAPILPTLTCLSNPPLTRREPR